MVRFKNRYLLVEIVWDEWVVSSHNGEPTQSPPTLKPSINASLLIQLIKTKTLDYFGDLGLASLLWSLSVKYLNEATGIFIIRTSREYFRITWGAMTFITSINNRPASLRVLHVAGTIRSCQKMLLKYDRELLFQEQRRQHKESQKQEI